MWLLVGWCHKGAVFMNLYFSSIAVMDKRKLFRHSTFRFVPRLNRLNRERQSTTFVSSAQDNSATHFFLRRTCTDIYRDRVNACFIICAYFAQF